MWRKLSEFFRSRYVVSAFELGHDDVPAQVRHLQIDGTWGHASTAKRFLFQRTAEKAGLKCKRPPYAGSIGVFLAPE